MNKFRPGAIAALAVMLASPMALAQQGTGAPAVLPASGRSSRSWRKCQLHSS